MLFHGAHTPHSKRYSSTDYSKFFLKLFYIFPLNYGSVLPKQLTQTSEHYAVFINILYILFVVYLYRPRLKDLCIWIAYKIYINFGLHINNNNNNNNKLINN